jgi:Transglycosylase SLT domain
MGPRALFACAASLALVAAGTASAAQVPLPRPAPKSVAKPAPQPATRATLCLMVESAAQANGLPVAFLTRVIWRESNFDPGAVGPMTRYGTRAQGIAQFMPGTAAEAGLADPFDPVQALPKAAGLLRSLAERFGNLGLAAAAYNAGPHRVHEWLDGKGYMPAETRAYVLAITGRTVDDWAKSDDKPKQQPASPAASAKKPAKKPANCETTLASLDQPPGHFAFELNRRVSAAMGKPWSVELAAGFSRERVLGQYARAMQRLAAVVGQQDPIVTRATGTRGMAPFYQARIGADTRGGANTLCARIRRAGGACLVLRTRF